SLSDLIVRRLATLPAPARDFLATTAVSGVPLARSLLLETQELAPADAEQIVDVLRAHHLARTQGMNGQDVVDIHHDRIREIIVAGLSETERRRCHLRLARILEAQTDRQPDVVATHYEGAGELAVAGRYWIAAADKALAALAFGHAADLYARSVAQAQLSPPE